MGYPPAPWRLHGELTLIPALVRAVARLSLRAAPALVTLETPGPFAPLGLAGTRLALAGDGMRLFMPAVRL
jgi:hypothetical protein